MTAPDLWADAAEPEADLSPDGWYVVRTRPNAEQRVAAELRARGLEVYLPSERRLRRHARRTTVVEHALLPGYLFAAVRVKPDFHLIRAAPGVECVLGRGVDGRPLPVKDEEVATLHLAEELGEFDMTPGLRTFQVGARVKIIAGPFKGFSAKVDHVAREKRVFILMQKLFGRQGKPFEIAADHLQAL
jgi:transcription antitermination factor NusG